MLSKHLSKIEERLKQSELRKIEQIFGKPQWLFCQRLRESLEIHRKSEVVFCSNQFTEISSN
jgi:hypothetical protein